MRSVARTGPLYSHFTRRGLAVLHWSVCPPFFGAKNVSLRRPSPTSVFSSSQLSRSTALPLTTGLPSTSTPSKRRKALLFTVNVTTPVSTVTVSAVSSTVSGVAGWGAPPPVFSVYVAVSPAPTLATKSTRTHFTDPSSCFTRTVNCAGTGFPAASTSTRSSALLTSPVLKGMPPVTG